jgi:hypothetical protein
LKLKCDVLLSTSAFKINLRRCIQEQRTAAIITRMKNMVVVRCFNKWRVEIEHVVQHKMEAGAYTRPLFS